MKISSKELKYYNNYLTYTRGYRIVYYYKSHYEIPNGLYVKEIKDFITFFEGKNNNSPKLVSKEEIIDKFLEKNPKALGAAIYSVDGNCIFKKNKFGVESINNSNIFIDELKYDYGANEEVDGYRLVYFYDDHYSIGEFCKTIEGFMMGFTEHDPINNKNDIPNFMSNDDLLNRCLNIIPDANKIAIYKTNGTCVFIKERNNLKAKK